ncbi:acetyl-CoA synthetase [Natronorubrum tibetense GA33]|uniref:Acetyl-CoA synthetase n=2 Tax=Natronorubrum tibetense TaxID=63128 RepID=L9VNE7_9EURY|nr:acetyl-CoA synthetase [Natronorubrum tibetense GA33]
MYDEARDEFDWNQAWDSFEGTPSSFNLGSEILGSDETETTAIRIVDMDDGSEDTITVTDIATRSRQFANFLDECGLSAGDRVAAVMEPREALYATIAGTWLGGYVYVPLYTLFGPEALQYRLENSGTKVLVTTPEHREKIDESQLSGLDQIVLVDGGTAAETTFAEVREYESDFDPAETSAEDICALQYTSGTTGDPRGVEMPHGSPVALYPYTRYAADLRPDDTFLGMAPPAWSYGLFYCTVVPLHQGTELITIRGDFDPDVLFDIIADYPVTSFFAPPTAFRQMAQLDVDVDSSAVDIRRIYSGGESVGASTIEWVEETFGTTVLEHYGFTEGGMLVNNYPLAEWEIKPGAMGKPIPGREVTLLDLEENEPVDTGGVGEISVRTTDEVPFAEAYFKMPDKSDEKFGGEWIRSDDLARRDEDRYFWYVGRADDVIISAGYRIGPSEVEDSLLKHDTVAEVGVVGLPDDERGQAVTAFIVPTASATPSDGLAEEIRTDVKQRLSKHEYPRRIEFVDELPKTASGKIQRYRLEEEYGEEE